MLEDLLFGLVCIAGAHVEARAALAALRIDQGRRTRHLGAVR